MPFTNPNKVKRANLAAAMGRNNKKQKIGSKTSVALTTVSPEITTATSKEKKTTIIDNLPLTVE